MPGSFGKKWRAGEMRSLPWTGEEEGDRGNRNKTLELFCTVNYGCSLKERIIDSNILQKRWQGYRKTSTGTYMLNETRRILFSYPSKYFVETANMSKEPTTFWMKELTFCSFYSTFNLK